MRYILLLLVLFLTSCSSTYKLSSYYSDDPIYGVTQSGDSIRVNVIDNEFQLERKFRTDFRFRYDFATYASNQPYSWYFSNRMFNRYSFYNPYGSFHMFHNSSQFWMNWAFDYPFNNFGYNWRDPFGFNNYYSGWNNWGMYGYGYNNWNNRPWNNNRYNTDWNRSRQNVSYNVGRRGSTNNVVPNLRNNVNKITPRVRVNQGRRIPTPDDIDVVIERPKRNALGRFIDKMEGNGIKVRTYQNPNNTSTPRIRNYNRVENNNRSNNNIIIRRNSNSVRQTPTRTAPTRTYSPPPSRSNNTGRSGGGVSVSRGSRGGKINQ